jgi:cytidyltransferase-like protein
MNVKKDKIVAVSGGFDPIHIGHVRMFNEAKKLGDKLIVILNNDNWLLKKKGYVFMNEKERKEILLALRSVDEVVITKHKKNPTNMSVCDALKKVKPDIFANGGDRDKKDSKNKISSLNPEAILCDELGIKVEFGVGRGGKVQSSSWLINKTKVIKK